MAIRTPADVCDDHLRPRKAMNPGDRLARNFAPDVVLLTGLGVFRGHDGVRASADILRRGVPDARYDSIVRLVEGDVAFLERSARSETSRIDDGADSFPVRGGRIVVRTIHYAVVPTTAAPEPGMANPATGSATAGQT